MTPVRFVVRARSDPQTLPRLINYVVQLGMIPRRVRADEADGIMTVLIEQDGLGDHQACIIANKMASSVLIEDVRLTRGRQPMVPLCGLSI